MEPIKRLEEEIEIVIEQRRQELLKFSGGLKAASELIDYHRKFLEKSKEELLEEIGSGKLTHEGANYVLRWLTKSEASLKEYQEHIKVNHDIRSGEIRAYDSVRRLIEILHEEEEQRLIEKEAEEVSKKTGLPASALTMNIKKRRQQSKTKKDDTSP
jgi:hypothetical protein